VKGESLELSEIAGTCDYGQLQSGLVQVTLGEVQQHVGPG